MNYNVRQFVLRSLRFYAAGHMGTLLGAAVAGAVLVGALTVGDSVRESLREMALARVGKSSYALAAPDRFFRAALADDLRPEISGKTAAAVLRLPGSAAAPDGSARANRIQVLGIDTNFTALARAPFTPQFGPPDAVLLNEALAAQLHAKVGDAIVLHVQKPSLLSQDVPISPQEDVAAGLRLTVTAIVSDAQFGRFSLQASQVPPLNAFVPISYLQAKTGRENQANLLLTGEPSGKIPAAELLRRHWTLADAGLELAHSPDGLEIRTGRIFIDPAVVRAAASIVPDGTPQLVLAYFVNEIREGTNSTPYSMVAALGAPLVPRQLRDNEIIIDQWLADDLRAKVGDKIRLSYFVPGFTRHLEEKQDEFRVRFITPLNGMAADRTLMPDFPGIAKAEKTENWDAGFAIDMRKIRPKDEAYWKQYRGTPKAFVTLAAGRRMWGNRFGDVTAIRFGSSIASEKILESRLRAALDPADLGLAFQPFRERALAASSQGEDFGGLFIGFSFFLIVAALILLAMLFQFGLEKRAAEIGALLALGWRPSLVRRAFLLEGVIIAAAGSFLGAFGGLIYARGIVWALTTLWRSAVAGSSLQFHATAESLTTGIFSGIAVSTMVIWFAVRRQTKRSARELLERGHELEWQAGGAKPKRRWAGWAAVICGVAALATIGGALARRDHADAEAFFSGGALLLISGISFAAVLFRAAARRAGAQPVSFGGLAWRGSTRRPNRSVATVALLASGSFLIAAVAANKLDATRDGQKRSSGTGGFAFIGESALPIVQDLNSKAGRDFFALDEPSLQGVQVVPFRVHDGDDASCLNLNHPLTPRLLGVDPEALQSRGAFTFSSVFNKSQKKAGWNMIKTSPADTNAIPAVGDEASIEWILQKKLGDTLDYTDDHGKTFKVKLAGALANSVLQGNLIIDSAALARHFPGDTGYRMFLIDAPSNNAAAVSAALARALQDRGLELTPAAGRLNAFNAVQNTYLDTFQVLGGLGLLLGSAGLGVVVLRNVLERRGELAVLSAVGFRRRGLFWLVLLEHAALECFGLLVGIAAAIAAVLPALLSLVAPISYSSLAVTLGLVFVSGLAWTWMATRLALRGDLLPVLRNE